MSGFELSGWALLGALLVAVALGVIAGSALGYFTASTDLQRERKNARSAGFDEGIATAWDLIGSDARRVAHPILTGRGAARSLQSKPKASADGYVFTSPPIPVEPVGDGPLAPDVPLAYRLFDQDAPTEAAVALELRGDD